MIDTAKTLTQQEKLGFAFGKSKQNRIVRCNYFLEEPKIMNPKTESLVAKIAHDNQFQPHKQYTEKEASNLLHVSISTLRRFRCCKKIACIQISQRCVRYFGYHIAEFLIQQSTCPATQNVTSINLENFGYPAKQEAPPGVALGTITKPDKRAVLASAQRILKNQRSV